LTGLEKAILGTLKNKENGLAASWIAGELQPKGFAAISARMVRETLFTMQERGWVGRDDDSRWHLVPGADFADEPPVEIALSEVDLIVAEPTVASDVVPLVPAAAAPPEHKLVPPRESIAAAHGAAASAVAWRFRAEHPDGAKDFGNSNVWSFEPTLATFVRESLQNALDEAVGELVRVKYSLIRLRGEGLESFLAALRWDELGAHLDSAADNASNQKFGRILSYGLKQLKDDKELVLLRVDDFGTSGLKGDEFGNGNFCALTRNNLDSNKAEMTAAGAFGLGKAVLWRTSSVSTVLFCSNLLHPGPGGRTAKRIFGRSELAWHNLNSMGFAGPGWYGMDSPERPGTSASVWEDEQLARSLHMDRGDEPGTSILVVGFHDPTADDSRSLNDLAKDLGSGAATNFWPAIIMGKLQVEVEVCDDGQVSSFVVTPEDHLPGHVAAFRQFIDGGIDTKLEGPGDSAQITVELRLPRRKSPRNPHPEQTHEATLIVRELEDANEPGQGKMALFRGSGMVIRYLDLRNIRLGARPFAACLLCGRAAGDRETDTAAEVFLRTAEPPAHNEWVLTPDLKGEYARGGGTAISDFVNDARDAVRELVGPRMRSSDDGPQALKELFRISRPSGVHQSKPQLSNQLEGGIDDSDRWNVTRGRIKLKSDARAWQVKPVALFTAETGAGKTVKWESLNALTGCEVVNGNTLLIPPHTTLAEFSGITDPSSYPLPARDCAFAVDLRDLRASEGGDES